MISNQPKKVSWAVSLLYASFALGVLRGIISALRVSKAGQVYTAGIIWMLAMCFVWLLTYKINRGKNWARLTYLGMVLVKLSYLRPSMLDSIATEPTLIVTALAQIFIQVVALVLLFQRESSSWYEQVKAGPNRAT